jgi:hypothetical protein
MSLDRFNIIETGLPGPTAPKKPRTFPNLPKWVEIIIFLLLGLLAQLVVFVIWIAMYYGLHVFKWKNPWNDDNRRPGFAILFVLFFMYGMFATSFSATYAICGHRQGTRDHRGKGIGWIITRVEAGVFAAVYILGTIIGIIEGLRFDMFRLKG